VSFFETSRDTVLSPYRIGERFDLSSFPYLQANLPQECQITII